MKLAAGAIFVFVAIPALAQQDEKALQDALKKFWDDFTGPRAGDDEKIDAVKTLAQVKCDRVLKTLAPLLNRGSFKVRMTVARELGAFANVRGAPEALVGALKTYETGNRQTNGIRIFALRSLGQLKSKDAAFAVEKLVLDKDTWIAKAAIDAAGQIRAKSSVDPLIRALHRVEGPDGRGEIPSNPLEVELPAVTPGGIIRRAVVEQARPKSERDVLEEPILQSLRAITHANFATAKEWDSWWSRTKSTFRVPE